MKIKDEIRYKQIKDELGKLHNMSCVNSLEGMFSQKNCWHCDRIFQLNNEMCGIVEFSPKEYSGSIQFTRDELGLKC